MLTYVWPSSTPRVVAGSSLPIFGRATLTTVPSRKTTDEPRTAASIVQRWRSCIGAVCDAGPDEASEASRSSRPRAAPSRLPRPIRPGPPSRCRPILPPPGRPEPSARTDPASHPRSLSYGRRVKLRRIRAVCPAAGAAIPSRRTLAAVQDQVRLGLAGATHPVQRSTRAHMARRRPRRHHPRRMLHQPAGCATTQPDAPPPSRMRHHPAGCATTQPNARSRADVRRCTGGNQGSQWRRTRHPIGLFAALRATDSPRSSGVGSPVADLLSPGQQAGPVDRPTALDSAWTGSAITGCPTCVRGACSTAIRPVSAPSPDRR